MTAEDESVDDVNQRMSLLVARLPVGVVTVMVAGDLDAGTVDAFHRQIRALLDDSCGGRLELDLSDLKFCDLAGMRAIQAVAAIGAKTQHQVRITAAAPCFDILLYLCEIPTLLGYLHHDPSPSGTADRDF